MIPSDTTPNSGCSQEQSHTCGGLLTKRISVDLFSRVEKSDERDPRGCGYFEWGDKNIVTKPICDHGVPCMLRDKTKIDRPYYICRKKIGSCSYFEWGDPPNEDPLQKKEDWKGCHA